MSPQPNGYFLLNEAVPGHRIFDLLGRTVFINGDSLKRPTESTVLPRLPPAGPDLKASVPDLYPTHIEAKDAKVLLERGYDQSAKASITKALNIFYTRKGSTHRQLLTPGFRRITMEEQPLKINSLLQQEAYSTPILEFFGNQPDAKLGVIVSIIACFEMEVENTRSGEHEGGGGVTVPSDAVGAPAGVGDVALEAKAKSNNKHELSGTYKDEVIIACGYVQMSLKPPESGWQFWQTHKPSPYDVDVTTQGINPKTMTVSVPATRINGDMEAILGGITEGDDEAAAAAAATASTSEPSAQDDDASDFVLFA